jgi:hypothetical protein
MAKFLGGFALQLPFLSALVLIVIIFLPITSVAVTLEFGSELPVIFTRLSFVLLAFRGVFIISLLTGVILVFSVIAEVNSLLLINLMKYCH